MDSVDLVEFGLQQRSRSLDSKARSGRSLRLRCPGCSCNCRPSRTSQINCIVRLLVHLVLT